MKYHSIRSAAAGLALLLLLASCANGEPASEPAPAETAGSAVSGDASADEPAAGEAAEAAIDPAAGEAVTEAEGEPETEEEKEAMTPEEALAAAMDYIGRPVSELIALIGEPDDRDYAPSCMGDGEDGNLYYSGFTVYTYRENEEETVQDVE